MSDARRQLPAVGQLLESDTLAGVRGNHPASQVRDAVRAVVAAARAAGAVPPAGWEAAVRAELEAGPRTGLPRTINATGVVLHTNLGRAPMAAEAVAAMVAAAGYTPVEFDLASGERGGRGEAATHALRDLTGAEAALVVNNAAGALVLAARALARGGALLLSRGEYVEIGGSFRIPEVLGESGVLLHPVGTTNRTRLDDYRRALGPGTAGILTVHRSNFRIEGFAETPAPAELASLAGEAGVPYIHDVGSGLMHDLSDLGLSGEPLVPGAVAQGADLVIFSGDKLLGGPQAGCLVGAREAIARCAAHPLARAVRADRLTLAALEATLVLHASPDTARERVPVLRMLAEPLAHLDTRARAWAAATPAALAADVVDGRSVVGGGAFAGASLPTRLLAVGPEGSGADALAARLRDRPVPIVARVSGGRACLDPRTVPAAEDDEVIRALVALA